ncbi:MAG: WG repeat-containing protein [Bacteroidales bacterium]|nr:WG repeat-containing protein [Bacteroidales bacterium]
MKQLSKWLCVVAIVFIAVVSCSTKSDEMKLIPVKSGDKWGYINPKGEYVINPQFDDAYPFTDGVALIEMDGKVGYINEDGSYLLSAQYKNGTPFRDGFAVVVLEGSVPTCIDKKGNVIFTLDDAKQLSLFREGMAIYYNNDKKCGYVDNTGKIIVTPQFTWGGIFTEDFALVKNENQQYGFIDKEGKIVINPQFENAFHFREGLAAFYNGKQWGFIDTKGAYVINPQFDEVGSFVNGLASVKIGKTYGYVDKTGKLVINPQFESVGTFSDNGLAAIKQNGRWGFIDTDGKIVINPQFDDVSYFMGKYALVLSAGKWGLIDKTGKYIVNPQFEDMHSYFALDYGTHQAVLSDYYDASAFVTAFMKKAENDLFDGLDTSATLQKVTDHPFYGDCINSSDKYTAYCNEHQKMDDNITIYRTNFFFTDKIYSMVPKYEYFYGYQYKTGEKKQYNFSARLDKIQYRLTLSGDAFSHGGAIATALKNELEKKYEITMSETKSDELPEYATSQYISEKGKYTFVIEVYDSSLEIYVGMGKKSVNADTETTEEDYYN